ncbi:cellulase family glycosylhydrolase [Fulvivirgaceae bacterium BMA10]|uniref:Cellulase family glycosylhydrolase n=1 Tax=Splendidivirga corallicola TaxID=3051826 RepID=A0ABT8KMD2_9BACT|nr:cellulase family glycosylhydrolase [Fulvivirgaceae bacterium BMA10]
MNGSFGKIWITCVVVISMSCGDNQSDRRKHGSVSEVWSKERAVEWQRTNGWLVGCTFIPSNAINQLEMWQEDSYDPETIDRELGWASSLGFNIVRVYLHHLVWEENPEGFKERMHDFLRITDTNQLKVMFVFFDDCWNGDPQLGTQPEPIPGVHNSGWVQCPGQKQVTDTTLYPVLKQYVQDIVHEFKDDSRVAIWDMYNEPGNEHHGNESLPLLKKSFEWAREIQPSQPITSAVWRFSKDFEKINDFLIRHSDVISFHNYMNVESVRKTIHNLKQHGRPLICTEYLARTRDSNFESHLPMFKEENVGAVNWGLVSGKTQTIFPWGSKQGTPEPELWYHDIFHKDGKPFDSSEVKIIRELVLGK